MEVSRYLRQHARTIAGKSQLFINSYAKALEVRDSIINCLWISLLLVALQLYIRIFQNSEINISCFFRIIHGVICMYWFPFNQMVIVFLCDPNFISPVLFVE